MTDQRFTRRRVIGTGAVAGVAAAAAGAAAGVAFAQSDTPPAIEASPRKRFENKVVLITGATSGIGRAAALLFQCFR